MKAFFRKGFIGLFILNAFCLYSQIDFNGLDKNGKKDGLWKGVYEESKRPKYEGTFSHGKEIGTFKFFDDTKLSSVIATREFNSKDNSAYTIFYDQANNKVGEGKVINKLFEGEWKYYHQASKNVMTIEHYKKGKLEGLRSVFFPSGKIAEEINYKNNLRDGVYKKYSENGVVIEECIYKNNKYGGLATYRDPNGNIVSNGKFVNGKKSGLWQFYKNGKLDKEIDMSDPKSTNKAMSN